MLRFMSAKLIFRGTISLLFLFVYNSNEAEKLYFPSGRTIDERVFIQPSSSLYYIILYWVYIIY